MRFKKRSLTASSCDPEGYFRLGALVLYREVILAPGVSHGKHRMGGSCELSRGVEVLKLFAMGSAGIFVDGVCALKSIIRHGERRNICWRSLHWWQCRRNAGNWRKVRKTNLCGRCSKAETPLSSISCWCMQKDARSIFAMHNERRRSCHCLVRGVACCVDICLRYSAWTQNLSSLMTNN